MTGRPPSTVEGEVRRMARQLRHPNGAMGTLDRLMVVGNLHGQVSGQTRYTGTPDPDGLVRIAAHCIVWAEEIREREEQADG